MHHRCVAPQRARGCRRVDAQARIQAMARRAVVEANARSAWELDRLVLAVQGARPGTEVLQEVAARELHVRPRMVEDHVAREALELGVRVRLLLGIRADAAEGDSMSSVGDIANVIEAQNVGGERAQAGENAGVAADAAGVLGKAAVTHIVGAVFYAPMVPDGAGADGGGQNDVR